MASLPGRGPRMVAITIAAIAVSLAPQHARGHDGLDEQVAALTRAIAARPNDAALYLQRGERHRLGRHWDSARRDYDIAVRLDPQCVETVLCRGALALDLGDATAAVRFLATFLALRPDHPEALWLRSRALRVAGQVQSSIADMDRAIALVPNPRPDQYLERARALANAEPPRIDEALAGLREGMRRLGPVVSLEEFAAHLGGVAVPAADTAPVDATAPRESRTASAPGSTRTRAALTRRPYLQRATPASIVVRWRTDVPTSSWVRYGDSPVTLASAVADETPVTEHVVTVTGLAPNTIYYYSIGTSTETYAGADYQHSFVTAPTPGEAVQTRVWVLGDSGLPGAQQNAVRDAFYAVSGGTTADVWLMLGDNAYNSGADFEYQVGLFDPYATTLRNTVLWPTRGNHDLIFAGAHNDYYDIFSLPASGQAGGVPSGTEAYYSFDHGNIHFVCLDSEGSDRSPSGAMATWLRADLTANTSDWTIAFWHHPPYSKGSHNSDNDFDSAGRMRDMRANFLPILDSLGVDLALTGHSHSYERSFLLDRHYGYSPSLQSWMILDSGSGDPVTGAYHKTTLGPAAHEGAVHVVAGSSSHISGGALNHPAMFVSMNVLGSMVLDIDGPRLLARFVDDAATVRDDFAIVKGPGGGTTSAETSLRIDLRMDPAQPNPFRHDTRIVYALPERGKVQLTVHDAAGRRVRTIEQGERDVGRHVTRWDGRDAGGRRVAAGVYFARLEFDGESRLGKIVLSR